MKMNRSSSGAPPRSATSAGKAGAGSNSSRTQAAADAQQALATSTAPRDSAAYFRQVEKAVRADGSSAAFVGMSFLSSVLPAPPRRPEVLKRKRRYDPSLSLMDVIRGRADDTAQAILQPHWPLEFPIAHIDTLRRTIVSNSGSNGGGGGGADSDDSDDEHKSGKAAAGSPFSPARRQPMLVFSMRVLTTLRIPLLRLGLPPTILHFWGLLDPTSPLRDGWSFQLGSYDSAAAEKNKEPADIFKYGADHAGLNLFVDWPASTFLQQTDEDAHKDEGPAWLTGLSVTCPSESVLQECRDDVYFGASSKPGAAGATPKRAEAACAHLLSNNALKDDRRTGASAASSLLDLPRSIEFVVKGAFAEWAVTWRARRALVRTAVMNEPDLAAAAALEQRSSTLGGGSGGNSSPRRRMVNPLLELEGYSKQVRHQAQGGSSSAQAGAAAAASSSASSSAARKGAGATASPAPDDYLGHVQQSAGSGIDGAAAASGEDPLAHLTTVSNLLRGDVDLNPFVSLASFVCARLRGLTDRCMCCGVDLPGTVIRPATCGADLCNYSAARFGGDFVSRFTRSSGAVAEFLILCAINAVATQREMLIPMCDVVVDEAGEEVVSTSPSAAATAVAAAAALTADADGDSSAAVAAMRSAAAAGGFSGATSGHMSGFASGGLFGVQFAAPAAAPSGASGPASSAELQKRIARSAAGVPTAAAAAMDPQMKAHLQQQFLRAGMMAPASSIDAAQMTRGTPTRRSISPVVSGGNSPAPPPSLSLPAGAPAATAAAAAAKSASPAASSSSPAPDAKAAASSSPATATSSAAAVAPRKPAAHHFYKRDDDVGSGNNKDVTLLHSTLAGLPSVPVMLDALRNLRRHNSAAQAEKLFFQWLASACSHDEGRLLCGPLLRWLFASMPGDLVLLPQTHVIPNMRSAIQFLVVGTDPEREARFQALKAREQERRRMQAALAAKNAANGNGNGGISFLDASSNNNSVDRIPDAKDDIFIAGTKQRGSFFAWHGSGPNNWHSILRNGLRNMSHTHLMSTGAIHGGGIYLARSLQISLSYSLQPVAGWTKAEIIPHQTGISVVGLVEVVDWNAVSCNAPDPRMDRRFRQPAKSAAPAPTDPVQVHADGQIVTVLQSEYCMLRALIVFTDRTPRGMESFELVIPKPLLEYFETRYAA